MAGIDTYRAGLRSAVRGFWTEVIGREQFLDEMRTLINRRLPQAFEEGAAECGLKPDEFTDEEHLALGKAIQEELGYIGGLADRVEKNRKGEGKLTPLLGRVSTLWLNRYRDLKNLAKQITCKDKKLMWQLGPTEVHCRTCPRLNGRVKRASFWKKAGVRPQNPPNRKLECKGYRCLCELKPTGQAVTKGPLPKTP